MIGRRFAHAAFRRAAALVALCALVGLALPSAALACSVCIGASGPEVTIAYRAMTAFMTFTPLAIVGSVIFWIWRRFKALDEAEAARLSGLAPRSPADPGR